MSLLTVRGLRKAFGGIEAVRGVSFEVGAGAVVAMIGPNGAGKTTCFNMLGGQLRPDGGSIVFRGRELAGLPARKIWRLGVGRTFQVPAAFENMTLLDNVTVGAFLRHPHRSAARERAWEVLEFTGLKGLAEQPAKTLGTPGRKRLEIARALATEPRLLLLDEALAGLTPAEIQTAIALVRRIHGRGITLVIVEHIMEVIMNLAQRVIVFNQGRIIAQGLPQDVVRNPEVIAAYLGHTQRPTD